MLRNYNALIVRIVKMKRIQQVVNFIIFNFRVNRMIRQILKKNYYFCTKSLMQRSSQSRMQRGTQKPKNFPEFTHFASVPFIREQHRQTLGFFQDRIEQIFQQHKLDHTLKRSNTNLMHITLSMLTLNLQQYRQKTVEIIKSLEKQISETLKGVNLTLGDVKYFKRFDRREKKESVSLFYLDLVRDQNTQKLDKVTDLLIRQMIKAQVIEASELKSMHIRYDHRVGMYINEAYHLTLFRIQGLSEDNAFQEVFKRVQEIKNQKQIKVSLECDFFDVSTRGHYDQTKFYFPMARVQLGGQALKSQ